MTYSKHIFILAVALLILFAASCSVRPRGVYHTVQPEETLWRIAQAYNCDVDELARANNLKDKNRIEAGQVIFVPGADTVRVTTRGTSVKEPSPGTSPGKSTVTTTPKATTPPKEEPKAAAAIQPPPATKKYTRARFIWPVNGDVVSTFGPQQNGMRHTGIKIEASEKTPVRASAGGIIIHSGPIKYFGETVIIKHDNNYTTVYANLFDRKVQVGDAVTQGALIALLGRDEKTGKECLHFEIRYKNVAKNPLSYLPKR
ncbi:MAG: peptidoglycan DD-metalloendopeptidase family protein [Deltaproteobacteria bacterium]|nr:peptidoglycan DD-metalloendopeptidase family protein [Deltaproteobacteria bacterium]